MQTYNILVLILCSNLMKTVVLVPYWRFFKYVLMMNPTSGFLFWPPCNVVNK